MNTKEVAQKFGSLVKEHREKEARTTLFASDVVSVEAVSMPDMPAETRGLAALDKKSEWWQANNEVHSAKIEGPYPHGDRFAMIYEYDITVRPTGQRRQMKEVALYTVLGDKIVREEFFYQT